MKTYTFLFFLLLLVEACSKPQQVEVVSLPENIRTLNLDSIHNANVLLNATGIVATSDYLIVANASKDTIFDVFERGSLLYLYSDLIYGQGPDDLLPFRWTRYLKDNDIYVIGLGTPVLTEVSINSNGLTVNRRNKIEWENDICQNIFPLSDSKALIQPGKKHGEWVINDCITNQLINMPEFPFKNKAEEGDWLKMFQNRAVNVAVNEDGKRIVFFYTMLPLVRLFDDNGGILYEVNVGGEIHDASEFLHERHLYYTRCISVGNYIFVKYNPQNKEDDFTYFQIWNWEGRMLSMFRIEGQLNLFTVSPDAKNFYAVKKDNDHIFRCSLEPIWKDM